MISNKSRKIVLCYVPGLDLRRVTAGWSPYLARLLDAYPSVRFRSLATSENLISLVTGSTPRRHGFWGPRLRPDHRRRTPLERAIDRVPEVVTTTAQCVMHLARGPIDLATMPPRRRRRFDWTTRFNVKFMVDPERQIRQLRTPSLFSVIGAQSRYVYFDDFPRLEQLLDHIAGGQHILDTVDNHGLDYVQHWNMEDDALIRTCYARNDAFLAALHEKCVANGLTLVVVSEHGQDTVSEVIDPRAPLRDVDVAPEAYDTFVETNRMALWFHDEGAKARLLDRLEAASEGVLTMAGDLANGGVEAPDERYGHAYFYARPGTTFYPNDFSQPVARVVLAMKDKFQRTRLSRPWHKGEHGYLPAADAERGFMVAVDDRLQARTDKARLIDVAPTVLARLGIAPPSNMQGRDVFAARG